MLGRCTSHKDGGKGGHALQQHHHEHHGQYRCDENADRPADEFTHEEASLQILCATTKSDVAHLAKTDKQTEEK